MTTALKDEYKHEIINYFVYNRKFDQKSMWTNLSIQGSYKISAITVIDKGKYPMVGALAEREIVTFSILKDIGKAFHKALLYHIQSKGGKYL